MKGPHKSIGLLTARPPGFLRGIKHNLEKDKEFSKYKIKIGPILAGCYSNVIHFFKNTNLGECKFRKLKQFIISNKQIIEENNKKIIFIGDNGQGDEYAAKLLLEDNITRKFIKHIYIHNVHRSNSEFDLRQINFHINDKLFTYFNTYNELIQK